MSQSTIPADVVIAYARCHRKAQLLIRGETQKATPKLASVLNQRRSTNQSQRGIQLSSPQNVINATNFNILTKKIITNALIQADHIEAYCDILTLDTSMDKAKCYRPTLIIFIPCQ